MNYPYFQPLLDEAPPRTCEECGCILTEGEYEFCTNCREGEAFAEDEWIEEN